MTAEDKQREELIGAIRARLPRVEARVKNLSRANTCFVYISILAGALATFVAGLSAWQGGPLIESAQEAKLASWKLTCGVAALLTLVATVASGLQKALAIADKLAAATACLGRLRALDLALNVRGANYLEVAKEFEALIGAHSDIL